MAKESRSAGNAASPAKHPYSGPNPHPEGSQAWHGYEYLKSTVQADVRKGIDVNKVEKPKMNIHAF